jgi:tetraacyldisaccharide 4'-kinase
MINRAEEDDVLITLRRIIRRHNKKALIFQIGNKITELIRIEKEETLSPEQIRGWNCYLFCAIGNPDAFSLNIEKLGAHVLGHKYFRDHHLYTKEDLRKIEDAARKAGASILLTTQKDMVRIKEYQATLSLPLYYAKLELILYQEEEFFQALKNLLINPPRARN